MNPERMQAAAVIGSVWAVFCVLNMIVLPTRLSPRVEVEIAKPASMPLIVRAPGTLEAKRSVTIKAEFEGPIVRKDYQEGKSVEEGQFLVEIGREKLKPEFENKRNQLRNAEADYGKALKDVKLQRALFKKQAVARQSVEEAERAVIRAQQALESAKATFELERARWNRNKVFAPFAGKITKDSLEEEPLVAAGKEIFTLADVSEYTVRARVDELEISQLQVGQPAEIRIQAYEQKALTAKVLRIGTQAEGSALPEIPVILLLNSTAGLPLLPKLTAEARIFVGRTSDIISVPMTAVDNKDGEPRVWVVDRFGRLRARKVVFGRSNGQRAEIKQGIKAGEKICVATSAEFAVGRKVIIRERHPKA